MAHMIYLIKYLYCNLSDMINKIKVGFGGFGYF